MQLRHAVDGLRLGCRGLGLIVRLAGAFIVEGIDGAVGRFGEPPRSAQVDDAQTRAKRLRHPLPRLLVRRGEKQHFNAAVGQQIPRERLQLEVAAAVAIGQLRMNLGQRNAAARDVLCVHAPGKDRRLAFQAGMAQQQPGQLRAGVPGHSHHCCLYAFGHDSSMVLSRASTSPARRGSGQITSTVSSPATVPTTSGHPSRSRAAATGWAPPITVPTTT